MPDKKKDTTEMTDKEKREEKERKKAKKRQKAIEREQGPGFFQGYFNPGGSYTIDGKPQESIPGAGPWECFKKFWTQKTGWGLFFRLLLLFAAIAALAVGATVGGPASLAIGGILLGAYVAVGVANIAKHRRSYAKAAQEEAEKKVDNAKGTEQGQVVDNAKGTAQGQVVDNAKETTQGQVVDNTKETAQGQVVEQKLFDTLEKGYNVKNALHLQSITDMVRERNNGSSQLTNNAQPTTLHTSNLQTGGTAASNTLTRT